ncbi:hepatic triacylglycerol lipase [Bufo bufo]|uniref:hepatic triacylglycerol lipase n=1 Tax=Bufo bufo TaxID=8384 RepID=UPI001ABE0613|nr:hepatic triacylglycerol lipase [Bufo bufo]XP_040269819.1 hepatic triacylglycerol lipase [Bufo bufo]
MGRIQILCLFLILLAFKQTVAKKRCKCLSDGNTERKPMQQYLSSSPYSADYKEGLRRAIQMKKDPNTIKAKLLLYKEGTDNNMCPVVAGQPESLENCAFNATFPLVVIVHGWSLDGNLEAWIPKMASAFKSSKKQINVIIVDWLSSAHAHYAVAVQNARFIGLEIAEFLEWLESSTQFPRSNVHLIGYSLGAHVSGFAGSYINGSDKLGRITGLDPAGPLFEGMSSVDRLSPDDASFVDAIHTNTKQHIGLSVGINEQVGHYDFYPNGGDIQPGCNFRDLYSHIAEHGIFGFTQSVKCSHERSVHLFMDSILNEDKPIAGYECKDIKTFEKGMCLKCPKSGCIVLGYNIKMDGIPPGHGLFLKTRSNMPFKAYHYQFKMQVTNHIADKQLFPKLSASLTGTKQDVKDVYLEISGGIKESGTYTFLVTLDTDIGDLMMIKLKWEGSKDIKNLWYTLQKKISWDTLPGLLVKRIKVLAGETQERIIFCAENVDDFELHPDHEKNYVRCLSRLRRKKSRKHL